MTMAIVTSMVRKRFQARLEAKKQSKNSSLKKEHILQRVRRLAFVDPYKAFRLFCEGLVRITTKKPGEVVPFRWNEIQRRLAREHSPREVVLKARQVGLTTFALARDLFFALVRSHSAVGVVTQPHKTNEPSRKVVKQLKFIVDNLGVDVGASWSGMTVTFDNGSTVTVFDAGGSASAADKQGRGGTYHRLHFTETAFYPYAEEVINALMAAVPEVDLGGEVIEESTPNGAHGLFYQHCVDARARTNGMKFHFFPWMLQPEYTTRAVGDAEPVDNDERELVEAARGVGVTLSSGQLEWWRQQRKLKSTDRTLQEYPHDSEKCFLLSGSMYFDRDAVKALEDKAKPFLALSTLEAFARTESPAKIHRVKAWNLAAKLNRGSGSILRLWETPTPGASYLVSVDTSQGKKKSDWLVAPVFNKKTLRHVGTLRAKVPTAEFARWCDALGRAFGPADMVVERNNHGHTLLHVLSTETFYPAIWKPDPAKEDLGFWTGPHNRQLIIDELADAIADGSFQSDDPLLFAECRTFVRNAEGKVEASGDNHDDIVMACAIGWHVLTTKIATVKRGAEPASKVQAAFG